MKFRPRRLPARAPISVSVAAIMLALVAPGCQKKSGASAPPAPAPTAAPIDAPTPVAIDCPPLDSEAGVATLATLTAKADSTSNGKVRVIARLSSASRVAPSMGDIHARAITTLKRAGVEDAKAISSTLPYIVAEMSSEELEQLYSNDRFSGWSEDHITYASLADSSPLVQAPDIWALGGRGKGQSVAILDTGVDKDHPFLAGRVVKEACFSTTSVSNGSTSLCADGKSSQIAADAARPCTMDGCDHGTHVAGIAAGKGEDFSGVAPDAEIVAIQVFSQFTGDACGGGADPCIASFTSDQIRALDYVLQNARARPIAAANLSLGGGKSETVCDDDLTKPVMDQLRALGVATVIAAGNESYRDGVSYPGCVSTAITVGATTKDNKLADFSNCGVQVDLLAPGAAINSSVPGGGFSRFSGTSMAAPHVAGAFAALRSLYPKASLDQIEAALKSSGAPVAGRPVIRLLAASDVLKEQAPPEVSVASADNDKPALTAQMAKLAALPQDKPIRLLVGVTQPTAGGSRALRDAITGVETAAKTAGAVQVERMGTQPLLVIEATPRQAQAIAQSPGVATIQVDRPATTQAPAKPN